MKQKLFIVFDLKSKTTASQVMVAPNVEVCKRNLITYAENIAPTIKKYPQDFAVFDLGEFDDTIPSIKGNETVEMAFSMTEVVDYARTSQEEA